MKINRIRVVNISYLIKKHWLKVFVIGILSFLGGFEFVKKSAKTFYKTSARIEIEPVKNAVLLKGENQSITSYYEDYVGTQIEKLKDVELLREASEVLSDSEKIELFNNEYVFTKELKEFIGDSLVVEHLKGTHLVEISIRSEHKEGIEKLLNSLLDNYFLNLEDLKTNEDSERINFLLEEKNIVEKEIEEKTNFVNEVAKEAGTGNFNANEMPYSVQMKNLEAAYVEAYKNRIQKEKLYNELQNEVQKIYKMPIDAEIEKRLFENSYYSQVKISLEKEVDLLEDKIETMSASNKERKKIEKKLNELKIESNELDIETREKLKKIIVSDRERKLELEVLDAYKEYQATLKQENDIKVVLDRTKEQYSKTTQKILKAKLNMEDLSRLKNYLNEIDLKISELYAEIKSSGRISIDKQATKVLGPAMNDLMLRLFLLLFLSFIWVIIVVLLYEIFDTRIKNPRDIKHALGFEPSWPISNYKKGEFFKLSIFNTTNVSFKAMKSLVTKLNKDREKHNSKITVFTGVNGNGGVTEIALNSAHIMKDNCDKVLLIELNSENNSLFNKLDINEKSTVGIKGILEGKEIEDCIYFDEEREIDILVKGETGEIPNKTISTILSDIKEKYDFIFIDSAPVMRSAMTEYLILKADIGVMVVHGNKTKYSEMVRAAEIIEKLELRSFSVMLNWGKN